MQGNGISMFDPFNIRIIRFYIMRCVSNILSDYPKIRFSFKNTGICDRERIVKDFKYLNIEDRIIE